MRESYCDQRDRQHEAAVLQARRSSPPSEGEPEMGANAISRLRIQRDVLRLFLQVKGSSFRLSPTVTDTRDHPGLP